MLLSRALGQLHAAILIVLFAYSSACFALDTRLVPVPWNAFTPPATAVVVGPVHAGSGGSSFCKWSKGLTDWSDCTFPVGSAAFNQTVVLYSSVLNLWVSGGDSFWVSADGVDWRQTYTGFTFNTYDGTTALNYFVFSLYLSASNGTAMFSPDGTTWHSTNLITVSPDLRLAYSASSGKVFGFSAVTRTLVFSNVIDSVRGPVSWTAQSLTTLPLGLTAINAFFAGTALRLVASNISTVVIASETGVLLTVPLSGVTSSAAVSLGNSVYELCPGNTCVEVVTEPEPDRVLVRNNTNFIVSTSVVFSTLARLYVMAGADSMSASASVRTFPSFPVPFGPPLFMNIVAQWARVDVRNYVGSIEGIVAPGATYSGSAFITGRSSLAGAASVAGDLVVDNVLSLPATTELIVASTVFINSDVTVTSALLTASRITMYSSSSMLTIDGRGHVFATAGAFVNGTLAFSSVGSNVVAILPPLVVNGTFVAQSGALVSVSGSVSPPSGSTGTVSFELARFNDLNKVGTLSASLAFTSLTPCVLLNASLDVRSTGLSVTVTYSPDVSCITSLPGPATAVAVAPPYLCMWTSDLAVWNACVTAQPGNPTVMNVSVVLYHPTINAWAAGGLSLWSSGDGVVWSRTRLGGLAVDGTISPNYFLFVGTVFGSPSLLYSLDGQAWSSFTLPSVPSTDMRVTFNSQASKVVVFQALSQPSLCTSNVIDAVTPPTGLWTCAALAFPSEQQASSAFFVGSALRLVTVSVNGTNIYSADGNRLFTYTPSPPDQFSAAYALSNTNYEFCSGQQCANITIPVALPDDPAVGLSSGLAQVASIGYSNVLGTFLLAGTVGNTAAVAKSPISSNSVFAGPATTLGFHGNNLVARAALRDYRVWSTAVITSQNFTSSVYLVSPAVIDGIVNVAGDLVANSTTSVARGSFVGASGTFYINGAATVASVIAASALRQTAGSSLALGEGASLRCVNTTLYGALSFLNVTNTGGLRLNASGLLAIGAGATLTVSGVIATNQASPAVFTLASYSSVAGSFSQNLFDFTSSTPCTTLSPSANVGQTALTVTVSFAPTPNCPPSSSTTTATGSTGLSTAALIGIIVGATVGGLLIIAAVVGVIISKRRHAKQMQELHIKLSGSSSLNA